MKGILGIGQNAGVRLADCCVRKWRNRIAASVNWYPISQQKLETF